MRSGSTCCRRAARGDRAERRQERKPATVGQGGARGDGAVRRRERRPAAVRRGRAARSVGLGWGILLGLVSAI